MADVQIYKWTDFGKHSNHKQLGDCSRRATNDIIIPWTMTVINRDSMVVCAEEVVYKRGTSKGR